MGPLLLEWGAHRAPESSGLQAGVVYIPLAGHFAHTDQPLFVADTILNFIRRVLGRSALADIYLGNEGIWKGDEHQLMADLRAIYRIDV